ncbi:site-specific integrase [Azotobacter sp. CWF10]
MSEIERYLQAGTRENTRRSYQAAIEHFEVSWGLSAGDQRQRGALSGRPRRQAVAQHPEVAARRPGPVAHHPGLSRSDQGAGGASGAQGHSGLASCAGKQAAPLPLQHLKQAVDWLDAEADEASARNDSATLLRCRRDAALLLIGFWRGFRSDELCRLEVERIQAVAGVGMEIHLPRSKGDRDFLGTTYRAPALKRLCPVQAYLDWIALAGLVQGPVFRRLDRWGNLGADGLNPNSLIALLRQILRRTGVPAESYSSHSLRRGFATWAAANGWDLKSLMGYVGWKDVKSAMRYIDPTLSFGGLAAKPLPESDSGPLPKLSDSL